MCQIWRDKKDLSLPVMREGEEKGPSTFIPSVKITEHKLHQGCSKHSRGSDGDNKQVVRLPRERLSFLSSQEKNKGGKINDIMSDSFDSMNTMKTR